MASAAKWYLRGQWLTCWPSLVVKCNVTVWCVSDILSVFLSLLTLIEYAAHFFSNLNRPCGTDSTWLTKSQCTFACKYYKDRHTCIQRIPSLPNQVFSDSILQVTVKTLVTTPLSVPSDYTEHRQLGTTPTAVSHIDSCLTVRHLLTCPHHVSQHKDGILTMLNKTVKYSECHLHQSNNIKCGSMTAAVRVSAE